MATYSSFKKIDSAAIVDGAIVSADIAAATVPTAAIDNQAVTAAKMSGSVTSAKIASTVSLSGKTVTYRPLVDADFSAASAIAGTKLASGAATANLGFTPVNAGGDTMTGTLTLPAGSVSAPSIDQSASTTTGIYFPTTNQVGFTVGGAQALNVYNGGSTLPRRPSFNSVGTTGWHYANSFGTGLRELGNVWAWALTYETGGSNFSPGVGRYTAPVSGYYHFNTMYYMLNDANSAPHYIHAFFCKNSGTGWQAGGRSPYTINMHSTRSSYDDGASYAAIMYLSASEYCNISVVWHNYSSRLHSSHQFFNGHLIG